jgi:hypothetical protein
MKGKWYSMALYSLRPETIEKISQAQRSVKPTSADILDARLFVAKTLMMNGKMFNDGDMWARGWMLAKEVRTKRADHLAG